MTFTPPPPVPPIEAAMTADTMAETITATATLIQAVPLGATVTLSIPNLRHGDITPATAELTVAGVTIDLGSREFSVDYARMLLTITNTNASGAATWAVGEVLTVTWSGLPLEPMVIDHETRITALEAGGGGSGGGAANHFTSPVYFEGDSSSDYGIYIDSPDKDYGAGILANLGGVRRWELMLGDGSPETMGTNQGSNFSIGRYSDYNQYMDEPLRIDRKSGSVILKIPECADSAAAGVAGVPIGGLYHVSGAVKVRLY